MKHTTSRLGTSLLALVFLGGCTVFAPHVHDLALVSAQVVPARVVKATGEARDDAPLLAISLSTTTDFVDIVQGDHFSGFNAFLLASACTEGQTDASKRLIINDEIFWHGGAVRGREAYYDEDYDSEKYKNYYPAFRDRALKKYTVFVPVRHVRLWPSDPIPISFDLEQHPDDICLAVAGGNMAGFHYQTNTVVVPKATIVRVLAAVQTKP